MEQLLQLPKAPPFSDPSPKSWFKVVCDARPPLPKLWGGFHARQKHCSGQLVLLNGPKRLCEELFVGCFFAHLTSTQCPGSAVCWAPGCHRLCCAVRWHLCSTRGRPSSAKKNVGHQSLALVGSERTESHLPVNATSRSSLAMETIPCSAQK